MDPGLAIDSIGEEGLHPRTSSSDNLISNGTISHTGLVNGGYGEGIYVGSAYENWHVYTKGKPDRSDRNQMIGNTIFRTGAESIDIKEGTTGGIVRSNSFDGTGMSGRNSADSWMDVKGNNYVISGNHGVHSLTDGFQVHVKLPGWGQGNVFTGNRADVDSRGYGFDLVGRTTSEVRCDNVVTNGGLGVANIACLL
jgi:hypothetical protein